MSELAGAGGVICFVWGTIGCTLEWRVVAYSPSIAYGDCAGVVFDSMGLYPNGIGWLLGFT
jgi:hypothetical protein